MCNIYKKVSLFIILSMFVLYKYKAIYKYEFNQLRNF